MNSSSVAASANSPRPASRSSWRRSTARGDTATGLPSAPTTSAITSAVPGSQGMRRRVDRSGRITRSPYPVSQPEIA